MAVSKKGISVKDIQLAEYNPRLMTDEAREGLSNSLTEFGDLSGITWNVRSKNLITGHQRWTEIVKKYQDLTLVKKDGDLYEIKSKKKGATGFFMRVVNWDDNKEKAANLTANNVHIQGTFDDEKLKTILEELKLNLDLSYIEKLCLDDLALNLEWTTDMGAIDAVGESLDRLIDTIVIECRSGQKEQVKSYLIKALAESEFTDASVR